MGKNYTRFARPICTPPFSLFIYICTVFWLDIFYGEAVFNNCVCHGKRANKAKRVQKKRRESNFNPWWNAKLLLPCIIDRLESVFDTMVNACVRRSWQSTQLKMEHLRLTCFRPSYPSASQIRFIEYKCIFHSHDFIYRRLYVSIFNLIFSSLVRQPFRNAVTRVNKLIPSPSFRKIVESSEKSRIAGNSIHFKRRLFPPVDRHR